MLTIFHPKGGMCAVCEFMTGDCSELPFNEMKLLNTYSKESDPNVFKVVLCNKFMRADNDS